MTRSRCHSEEPQAVLNRSGIPLSVNSAKEASRPAMKIRRAGSFAQFILSRQSEILRAALSKSSLRRSFPRRRESSPFAMGLDPRLRGVKIMVIFISLGGPEPHDHSE